MSNWMSTSAGGGAAIGQEEVDSRNENQALADHNTPAAVRTVCALLTNDALTAIGNLPTPDDTLTDDLNNAFQDASAAGNDCYKGASGDRVLLARSAAERSKLVALLATAVTRYETLTGHPPSTTTTLSTASNDDPFAP